MSANSVIRGAAWTYGAQLISIVAQLAYAAITSRLLDAAAFGTYAVALFVAGFITLLASSGLGQSVARLMDFHPAQITKLFRVALGVGVAAGIFILATADLWASFWGDSTAAKAVRWTAILAIVSAPVGVSSASLRRLGRFRQLALMTLGSNLVGMMIGAAVVYQFRSPSSLLASTIIAQSLILLISVIAGRRYLFKSAPGVKIGELLSFTWRVLASNILAYMTGSTTRWGVSRLMGAAPLGLWNRAEIFTTIPFQQLQNAMIQAVYPEIRHDINSPGRARIVWPHMLTIAACVAFSVAALIAAIGPYFVTALLGEGWNDSARLLPLLAVASAMQLLSTILASAIEALGKFRWIWGTQALLIVVQVGALGALYFYRNLLVVIGALVITGAIRHAIHVILCVRSGYIDIRLLVRGYLVALISAAIVFTGSAAGVEQQRLVQNPVFSSIILFFILLSCYCFLLALVRLSVLREIIIDRALLPIRIQRKVLGN